MSNFAIWNRLNRKMIYAVREPIEGPGDVYVTLTHGILYCCISIFQQWSSRDSILQSGLRPLCLSEKKMLECVTPGTCTLQTSPTIPVQVGYNFRYANQ